VHFCIVCLFWFSRLLSVSPFKILDMKVEHIEHGTKSVKKV